MTRGSKRPSKVPVELASLSRLARRQIGHRDKATEPPNRFRIKGELCIAVRDGRGFQAEGY